MACGHSGISLFLSFILRWAFLLAQSNSVLAYISYNSGIYILRQVPWCWQWKSRRRWPICIRFVPDLLRPSFCRRWVLNFDLHEGVKGNTKLKESHKISDVTYWGLLVPGYYMLEHKLPLITFWTYNHHGVNALFMITEFTLNKIPMYALPFRLNWFLDL